MATRGHGFELPGTVMTLTYTDRQISGAYLILGTEIRIIADKYPQYTYRFVEGDETIRRRRRSCARS